MAEAKDTKEKYACDHEGCGKSYNRLEHLTRHKLNHDPVARRFTCPTCSKMFVRGDLLRRHLPSHNTAGLVRGRKRKASRDSSEELTSPFEEEKFSTVKSIDLDSPAISTVANDIAERTDTTDMASTIRRYSHATQPVESEIGEQQIGIGTVDRALGIDTGEQRIEIDTIEQRMGIDTTFAVDMMPVFGERDVFDFSTFPFDDRFTNWLLDDNSAGDGVASEGSVSSTVQFDMFPPDLFSLPSPPVSGEIVSPEALARVCELYSVSSLIHVFSLANNQNTIPDLADYLNSHLVSGWVHLYWRNFHPQYPILHKPTSDPNTIPPYLLVAMFTLGTKYDPDSSSVEIAIKLHLHLRTLVYGCPDFVPPAKLWVFQTLLLGEMFEKIVANRHLHEMSHVFHGTLITLMRRGSSLINPELTDDGTLTETASTLDRHWKHWIKTESTIRTAFFAFIVDIQHAEMFGHTPALYANELSLELPCDDNLWTIADPETWSTVMKSSRRKRASFFASLKLVMSHGWNRLRLNPFGRYIVLHGLLSISWTMRQRGIISGISKTSREASRAGTPEQRSDWSSVIYKAFETWKLAFDLSESENPSTSGIPFILASSSLHRLGIIRLYTDVLQLHVYAGLSNVLGRPIRAQDWLRAEESMKLWARSSGSSISVWHASRLVSGALLGQSAYSADSDIVLHRPWCLYIACLVLWAYGYAMENCSRKFSDAFGSAWNARDDMERYLDTLLAISDPRDIPSLQTKNCTIGLMTYAGTLFKTCKWTLLGEEASYHCRRLACAIPVRS